DYYCSSYAGSNTLF
nr:immunoglobulin light chain junction region [Macaca mulatta]MOW17627.1 immunoglobulin light chain junction region [Macaca mulatta]MOX21085.1 immunoglobulin light chain junction region [Macaca mulatta]